MGATLDNNNTETLSYIIKEFNMLDNKMDVIIEGQADINKKLAVESERRTYSNRLLEQHTAKLDSHDSKIRDIEEIVRQNTQSRTKIHTWIERFGLLAVAAYFGFDKIGS